MGKLNGIGCDSIGAMRQRRVNVIDGAYDIVNVSPHEASTALALPSPPGLE